MRIALQRDPASDDGRLGLAVHAANGILEAHRWLPWISRPTPFDRPNHGDPFVTPVSPRVRVTIVGDRAIRWATTGEQVAARTA